MPLPSLASGFPLLIASPLPVSYFSRPFPLQGHAQKSHFKR